MYVLTEVESGSTPTVLVVVVVVVVVVRLLMVVVGASLNKTPPAARVKSSLEI